MALFPRCNHPVSVAGRHGLTLVGCHSCIQCRVAAQEHLCKLKKGSSFAGCIRYVTGKDEAKILASDGVLLGTNAEMMQSFELQRQLNPRIKKPVGHIALSFKPEDKPRLTDEFMAKIALEYMQMMGIKDTQFIIVRHHNTDNPHCHIVYNRINNEGKLISDRNDYRRNEQVTKALKSNSKRRFLRNTKYHSIL